MASKILRIGDVIVISTFAVSIISMGFLGGVLFDNSHAPTIFIRPAVDSLDSLGLPRASLGMIGSCYQPTAGDINSCNHLNGNNYFIDDLPNTCAKRILLPPPNSLSGFVWMSFIVSVFFGVYWIGITIYRVRTGNRLRISLDPMNESKERMILNLMVKWVPFIGWLFGLSGFLAWYMLSMKMVHDFNGYNDIRPGGRREDDLSAKLDRGFIYAWISFASLFHALTVLWVDGYTDEPNETKA